MSSPRILFIGHGKIGSAIHHVLTHGKKNPPKVDCWDVDRTRMKVVCDLAEAVPRADVIFLCVPSWNLSEATKEIKPYLKSKTILIGISKGLDRDTSETVDAVIARYFPKQPFALLFGPMLADELIAGHVGAASVASSSSRAREMIEHAFRGTALRVIPTRDVRGTALCGVLKNIYAIGLGIARELDLGDNFGGWYVEQALEEMGKILKILGGKSETRLTPAGIGDLVATGFSAHSKNVSYGRELVMSGKPTGPSEGSISIPPLKKRLGAHTRDLPLFQKLERIVVHGADPRTIR
jgi:glycerol-3-phosphate dehydrogenase (NAD(P)+)